jgi:hypothetical protein
MPATAWYFLQTALIRSQGSNSLLARAMGRDFKGKASFVLYIVGIVSAFIDIRVSDATYVLVALMWLVPERRIEKLFGVLNRFLSGACPRNEQGPEAQRQGTIIKSACPDTAGCGAGAD